MDKKRSKIFPYEVLSVKEPNESMLRNAKSVEYKILEEVKLRNKISNGLQLAIIIVIIYLFILFGCRF
jgi:hypothetical protein